MVELGKALCLLATVASTHGPRCPGAEGIAQYPASALQPSWPQCVPAPHATSQHQSSWYFHARQANELVPLAARLLDPTALQNVVGLVKEEACKASTLSEDPTRQVIGKSEMKSAGLRPDALWACYSHHPWLLQALLATMKLQQAPSSAQATKPVRGGDEGGETLLHCGSQPVEDDQLCQVRLCHFGSQLLAAGDTDAYFLSRLTTMKVLRLFFSRNEEEPILSNHGCILSHSMEFIQHPHFRFHLHPTQPALLGQPAWDSSLSFRVLVQDLEFRYFLN